MYVTHYLNLISSWSWRDIYEMVIYLTFFYIFQVGFEMVDTIAEAEGISMTTVSFKALFGKGSIRLDKTLLLIYLSS